MPHMQKCPYCYGPHVDTFPCKRAKAAGITSADLPDAYYIDTNTGPPPRGKETIPNENLQESTQKDDGKTVDNTAPVENGVQQETIYKRKWRAENWEREKETMRQWREDNREAYREYMREYMRRRRKARQE